MSNLKNKTKKELIDIILRKDDKELELNQAIDSKQVVISDLEEELKINKDSKTELEKELNSKKEIISELEKKLNVNSNAEHIINELESKNKELNEKVLSLKKDIKQNNENLCESKKLIDDLDKMNKNYVAQLNDADEAINNCKQVITNTECHLKRVNTNNKLLLIVNFLLIIALAITIFVK